MNGIRTVDLPPQGLVDSLVGNRDGSTSLIDMTTLVAQIGAQIGPTHEFVADLATDLDWPAGSVATVWGDGAASGVYKKQGPTGSGSWSRVGDIPLSFIASVFNEAADAAARDAAAAAVSAADALAAALGAGGKIYADTAAGIADTNNSANPPETFLVVDNGSLVLYRNMSGVAVLVARIGRPEFQTSAALAATTALTDGATYAVTSGFNGAPEAFRYDASSTLTVDGTLVIDPTGMAAGRLISKRTRLASISEVLTDVRTFDAGVQVSVVNGGAILEAVASGGSVLSAGGQRYAVLSGPRFDARTVDAATEIRSYPDGTECRVAGQSYAPDSSVTLADSVFADLGIAGVVPYGDTARLSQYTDGAGTLAATAAAAKRWASCGLPKLICDMSVSVDGTLSLSQETRKIMFSGGGQLTQTAANTLTLHGVATGVRRIVVENPRLRGKGAADTASTVNAQFNTATARAHGILLEHYDEVDVYYPDVKGFKNTGVFINFVKTRGTVHYPAVEGTHNGIGSIDPDIPLGDTGRQQFGVRFGSHNGSRENWRASDAADDAPETDASAAHGGGTVEVIGGTVGNTSIGIYVSPGYDHVSVSSVKHRAAKPLSQHLAYTQCGNHSTYHGHLDAEPHGTISKWAFPAQSRREPARNVLIEHITGKTQGSAGITGEGLDKAAYQRVDYDGQTGSVTDFNIPFDYTTDSLITASVDTGSGYSTVAHTMVNASTVRISPAPTGDVRIEFAAFTVNNGPARYGAINPIVRNVKFREGQQILVSLRNCYGYTVQDVKVEGHSTAIGRSQIETLASWGRIIDCDLGECDGGAVSANVAITGTQEIRNVRFRRPTQSSAVAICSITQAGSADETKAAFPITPLTYWIEGGIGQFEDRIYRCTKTGITAETIVLSTSHHTSGTAWLKYVGNITTMRGRDKGTVALDDLTFSEVGSASHTIYVNDRDFLVTMRGCRSDYATPYVLKGIANDISGNNLGQNIAPIITSGDNGLFIDYGKSVIDGMVVVDGDPAASSVPSIASRYWQRGQVVWVWDAAEGSAIAYRCVGSGTPGTWRPWGGAATGSGYATSGGAIDRNFTLTGSPSQVENVLATLIADLRSTGVLK